MTKVNSKPGMSAMDWGRIGKALDRQYRYEEGVLTLGQFLDAHTVIAKHEDVQTHSEHKINLEYKVLAQPKTHYTITIENGAMYDVPKIVYDCLAPGEVKVNPYTFAEYNKAIADKLAGSGIEWFRECDWENWQDAYAWILSTPVDLLKEYAAGYESGDRLIVPVESHA